MNKMIKVKINGIISEVPENMLDLLDNYYYEIVEE